MESSGSNSDKFGGGQDAPDENTDVVLPRTLGIRPLKMDDATTVYGVYGGFDADVWCATFFDEPEAQAWIIASNQFGQAVKGKKIAAAAVPKVLLS